MGLPEYEGIENEGSPNSPLRNLLGSIGAGSDGRAWGFGFTGERWPGVARVCLRSANVTSSVVSPGVVVLRVLCCVVDGVLVPAFEAPDSSGRECIGLADVDVTGSSPLDRLLGST